MSPHRDWGSQLDPSRDPSVEGEVRFQLDQICNSKGFSRSQRLRQILTFIVTHDLEHPDQPLSAKAIREAVFDGIWPADDGDPTAAVRVQVGRLRQALDTYYRGEGRRAPIRISIAHQSYQPIYERCSQEVPVGEDKDQRIVLPSTRHLVLYQRLTVILAVLGVVKIGIIIYLL